MADAAPVQAEKMASVSATRVRASLLRLLVVLLVSSVCLDGDGFTI